MRIHQAEIWIADVAGWEGCMNVNSPKEISDFNVRPVYWPISRRGLVFALRTSLACSSIESINDSRAHFSLHFLISAPLPIDFGKRSGPLKHGHYVSKKVKDAMKDESNSVHPLLVPVHTCLKCGGVFRREVFEGRMHTTGIFTCPACGTEGPLNLEIRELDRSESSPTKSEF
jgi:hypothetical protein